MDDPKLHELCLGIPKIELHCHLYGTVRQSTMLHLNRKAGLPLSEQEIKSFYHRGKKPKGVLRFFRALDECLICSPSDIKRITLEYLEDASAHNIKYCEIFWNPTGTVKVSNIQYPEAQGAIIDAFRDGERKFGVIGRLIASIDREGSNEEALEMVDWMIDNKRPELIGIGIDYREELGPPEKFIEAYTKAKQAGFKATAHAGEFGCPPAHIWTALDKLGVDRIDHGYTILQDKKLIEKCKSQPIVFTVVPTNSYYLRILEPEEWATKHPIRGMIREGLRVFPNTDDPSFHNVNPTESWMMMVSFFGATIKDLKSFVENSIDAAWIDNETKKLWKATWLKYFDRYTNEK